MTQISYIDINDAVAIKEMDTIMIRRTGSTRVTELEESS